MNYQFPNNSPEHLTTEDLMAELLRRKAAQQVGPNSTAITPLPNQPFSAAPTSHRREVEVIDLDSNRGEVRKQTWGQSE